MSETSIAQLGTQSKSAGELVQTRYWERHPGLAQIGERYLSRAKIRQEREGLVFTVRTSYQLKAIQQWKEVLEATLNAKIISFEISAFEEGPSLQQRVSQIQTLVTIPERRGETFFNTQKPSQLSIQLAPQNPEHDKVGKEKQRRMLAPTIVSSPAYDLNMQMVQRWATQLNQGSQALWIHGEPGSGKTTLLRQLNHWVSLDRRMECLDVISFFHEWRKALDTNNTFNFIKKYRRDTDVLIIENLDELRGKTGTQQELLFTLNALADRGASFAVSSSRSPHELREELDPQLFSRLFSGIAVELRTPDRIFKENLWRQMMNQHGLGAFSLDLQVTEKLFAVELSCVRKVHAFFLNAIARLSCSGRLSLTDVHDFEGSHLPQVVPMTSNGMNPRQLIERVAKICGVSSAVIMGRSRRAEVVVARKFVFLSLSRMLGMTNTSIAHYAEKDPSTVCHSLKTIQDDLVNDRHVAKQWNWICAELGMKEFKSTSH